ncbi:MAG TPA: nuclear transport factor 2 family protein [Bryobacteraceae bacterium]|nr:nuclear transport factor 2 family protein [Bryobacteraceae bacterium]
MKLLAVVVCSAMLGAYGSRAAQLEDATAEIKPLMEKVNAAWMTLDPSKAAPYYAKDAGLAFFDIAPLKYAGWREYQEGSEKVFSDWKSIKLTMGPDFKAYKNGNFAWATYTMAFEIEPKSGDTMKATARGTDVFEKRGGQWIIVHEHVSAPMP